MGHLIESKIARCTNPEHVGNDDPCTWLSVADVNQAGDYTLDGVMLRELGLALGEHVTKLRRYADGWEGHDMAARITFANRVSVAERTAKLLDVDRLETLMLPWQRGRNHQ